MTVSWTELGDWGTSGADKFAAGTGSAWTDKDLYTDHSVPKGAIAFIICENAVGDGTDVTMGVRIKGSSLDRYITLHEAEAGGGTHYGTWVKTDTNGYIQYYSSSTTGCTFYIAGYLSGSCDFTEAFELKTATSGAATGWIDWTLAVGASAVHYIVGGNPSTAAATYLGVRANGSSLVRYLSVHESEYAASGYQCTSMAVKSDSSKIIDYYHTNGKAEVYWDMGYFNSDIDYTDLAPTAASVSINSTWTSTDFTAYLDVDGRLCDTYVGTNSSNAEINVGSRAEGSSNPRYLSEHESETNVNSQFGMPAKTNDQGNIEFYCSNAATEYMGIIGYYKFTEPTPTAFPYSFGMVIG